MELDQKLHNRIGRKLGLRTSGQAQQTMLILQTASCRHADTGGAPPNVGDPIISVRVGAQYERSLAVPNKANLFLEMAVARFYQMNRLKEDILHLRKKHARLRAQIRSRRYDLRMKLAVLNGIDADFVSTGCCTAAGDIAVSAVCSLSQQVEILRSDYEKGEKALAFRIDQLKYVKGNSIVSTIDNIKAETKLQEAILQDAINKVTVLRKVASTMYEKIFGLVQTYENKKELKHSLIAAKMALEDEMTVTDKDDNAIELRSFKRNLNSRLPPELLHSRDVSDPAEYVIRNLNEFLRLMNRASAITVMYQHMRAPLSEFRATA